MPILLSTLTTTTLVVIVYFWVVRLIDMNEKEPIWAMSMLFALGACASVALRLLAPTSLLDLTVLPAALLEELARFVAAGVGVYALTVYGRWRGWQEFNGTMDGIVYGACAGLGFAIATQVRSELIFGTVALPGAPVGLFAGFGRIALTGLTDGLYGAILGAGIGASTEARSAVSRAALPAAGMVAAVVAHAGLASLAHGDALSGTSGLIRAYAAWSLPIVAVAATVVFALRSERHAIRQQLASEVQAGVLTATDFALLQSVFARSVSYWNELLRGRLSRWLRLRQLHNRQVQLALVKNKASRAMAPEERASLDQDVGRLRENIIACQRALGGQHTANDGEVKP